LILNLILCTLALAVAPPEWPQQFTATGVLSLPYGYGIQQPIGITFDATNNRAKIDYFNGMDSYYYRFDISKTYAVVPRIDTMTCFTYPSPPPQTLQSIVPDLTNWTFAGTQNVDGQNLNAWVNNMTVLGYTSNHTMLVFPSGRPYRLIMQGYDFLFGSHPDIYILDYSSFIPYINADDFIVPSSCTAASTAVHVEARSNAMLGLLKAIVEPPSFQDHFGHFQNYHKKNYASKEEEATRRLAFTLNQKKITKHNMNANRHGYTLKPNHFLDFPKDEFERLVLPKSQKKMTPPPSRATRAHPEPTPEQMAQLPSAVDWRKLGAVTMVKDQGVCGSCWTFGTTGSIEGCWAAKYGKLVSISEQQIVDCAWVNWGGGGGDSGCDGGFAAPAMDWVMNNGGIATEAEYPYLMVDSWCLPNKVSSGITLQGYVNVSSSEAALQHAVATVGPVAVAIDAAHDEFVFYGSGVYYNPQCKNDLDDLDHEVLVVGYGTDESGADYWIVKNSWSTHWGDEGYIKMARNRGNNCGIATQANYPLV